MFCRFYLTFDGKIRLANTVDPDQIPHNGFPGKNGLNNILFISLRTNYRKSGPGFD